MSDRLAALEHGKASKEFVMGGFFVALLLQFAGFLAIAEMKVDPVREDIRVIREAIGKLAEATDTNLSVLSSIQSSVTELEQVAEIRMSDFGTLTQSIAQTKVALEDFTTVWSNQPSQMTTTASALEANFRLYFQSLPEEDKQRLLSELAATTEGNR